MNDYCLKKRNYVIFNISFIIRMIGVGIFNTLFNLYVFESGFSAQFLGLFLSVGNLSMALSSIPIGILVDKYSKKKMMIIFTLVAATCFLIQSTVKSELFLLFISAIYGFASIGLFTIVPPYLKEYDNTFEGANLIAFNRSVNIVCTTIGALLCGFFSGGFFGFNTQNILILAAALYFFSIIPLMILNSEDSKDIENEKDLHTNIRQNNVKRIKVYLLIIIILFFFLGVAPLITNYINLYFKNRFLLDISKVSYVYALINLGIGIFVMFFSKVKIEINKKSKTILYMIIVCIVAMNILLAFVKILLVQILSVFVLLALFECLVSYVYDLILSYTPSNIHGRISGVIQMSANLSETIGIYICGLLLANNRFVEIHFISLFTTLFAGGTIGLFLKYRKERELT